MVESSMDPVFENSLRTPADRTQRIFDIQERVRAIEEKIIPGLQEEKHKLEVEKLQLRSNCEHQMPDGRPAWDDYFGKGKSEKCRICYKPRGDVPVEYGGLFVPPIQLNDLAVPAEYNVDEAGNPAQSYKKRLSRRNDPNHPKHDEYH